VAETPARPNRASRLVADYRILAGAKLRSDWQYRLSFLVLLCTGLLLTALDFAGIAVVFTRTPALGGWTLGQVAFLYGVAGLSFGVANFVVGSVEMVSPKVRDGSFDLLLIRPVNVLVNLTASEFNFRRVGRVAQAATVFAVAVAASGADWTAGRVLMLPVMVVSGTVIAAATWVITSSVAFWTVNTQEMASSLTYGGNLATSYPVHVLEPWLRVLLTYVVPLVFVNYLPALYILDLDTPLALPPWLRFASPAVAVAMSVVARVTWRAGLRHYRSTGS
jgi:ABC-2 type transport system permease protein